MKIGFRLGVIANCNNTFFAIKSSGIRLFIMMMLMMVSGGVFGQIVISQIYEGASSNRWIEITNIGASSVNLASPTQYKIGMWNNAAISGAPASFYNLTGTLSAGASLLVRNSTASTTVPHSTMPSAGTPAPASLVVTSDNVTTFTGNDPIAIFTGTNTIVDAFGDGTNICQDKSFYRNSTVTTTNTTFILSEWTERSLVQVAATTSTLTDYLGRHIFTPPSPCSGTPTAGTTVAATNPVVGGGTTALSLSGTSTGSGLTYQWQSSPDNGTYTDIGSATISTYTATPSIKTWYRCVVTCSGSSANSTPVEVSLTYCTPTYSSGPGTTDQITNVTLGTLNNTSGASSSPYYTFFNAVTIPNITQSSASTVSVTFGSDTNQYGAVWIDFNQNGVFEASEGVISGNAGASGTTTFNFSVPAGAILGQTRMRVRGGNDSALTTAQACGATSSAWGETEDYIVNVIAASASPILAITGTTAHGSSCPTVATVPQTYTITNSGGSSATGVTVVSNDPQFVVSGLSSTTITASGGTATYVVTFTPSSAGAKTATISVASVTAGSNSPTSSLTGTGTATTTPVAVTSTANNITINTARLRATNATTFGICPNTTVKGFVYAQTSLNASPTVGGSNAINLPVAVLGTTLNNYNEDVTGLLSATGYSYRTYLYDGTTYTYGSVATFTTLTPPINDLCTDATTLTINATAVSGTLVNSSTSTPFTATATDRKDVWYKFTAPCNGIHTVTVSSFTGNVDVHLYDQTSLCPSTTTRIGQAITISSPEIITTGTLTSGAVYYIRVLAVDATADTSTFTIAVNNQMTISTNPSNQSVTVGATATFASSLPANATGYQWQVNTGSSWANVSAGTGGTTNSYTTAGTTLAMSGYQYRVVISNGNCTTATSTAATLTVASCTSVPSSNDNSGITSVTVGSATFPVSDVTYYNYTTSIPTLTQGTTVTSSVTFATAYAYDTHIWIDFNDDGVFDNTSEKVYTGVSTSTNPTTLNTSFALNFMATVGQHKMRIGTADDGQATPNPCYSGTFGVTIDLVVNVIPDTTDTRLNFMATTYSVAENNGTFNLCVSIQNPSPSVATTANVVKTTITSTHFTTTTYPITFPAGSSAQQCILLSIADNTGCSDTTAYTFELQSVSGGISAMAGNNDETVITINDNDGSSGVFRKLDFEGCDTWGYTSTGGTFTLSSDSNQYTGTQSLRITGTTASTITLDNISLSGYSNVSVSLKYAATGVDNGEDLFLDVSYDNGSTWTGTGSIQLYDGLSDGTLAMGSTNGNSQTNPYTFSVLSSETQIRLRLRTTGGMSAEYYYIDDITLTGDGCNVSPSYGTPTSTTASTYYINNVEFQGINAVQNLANGFSTSPSGYQNWTANTKTIQAQGEPINVSLDANTPVHWKAWVDWNKDGSFDSVTEEVYTNGTYTGQFAEFGFVVPLSTAPGDYRIRFRVGYASSSFNACSNTTNGEAEDYLFTVIASCSALISNVTDGETCGPGTVDLAVTATGSPSEYRWYVAETGGAPLATTAGPTWTSPSISSTTIYYVTAYNGCESNVRTPIEAKVSPLPVLNFSDTAPSVCGESSIIELTASGDKEEVLLFHEKFDSGLGLFSTVNNDSNNGTFDGLTQWRNETSTYLPTGDLWTPAISSGVGGNKFAFATSDIVPDTAPVAIENQLTLTTGVSTTDFLNLTLTLRVFYSRYLNDGNSTYLSTFYRDDLRVELSDGTTWTTLATYDIDLGIGNKFQELSFSLPSTYLGISDLKVRVIHYSSSSSSLYFPGGVAIDDIKLFGEKALTTAFEWTSVPAINAYTDAACTALYDPLNDVATTVYFKATEAQLANPSFTISANAELSNGCTATDDIVVTNNSKFWTGAISNDWSVAGNWSPSGVPSIANCIVVNDADALEIPALANTTGKNLTIQPVGQLTINSNATLTIAEDILISDNGTPNDPDDDGELIILDGGSLIQVTNPAIDGTGNSINNNAGTIKMQRFAKPMYRFDYTYWSSPVKADPTVFLLGRDPDDLDIPGLSPLTLFNKYFDWDYNGQAWSGIPYGNQAMAAGRGYIVRAPQTYNIEGVGPSAIFEANFIGVPNNGIVRHPVSGSSDVNDNFWNLLGNPYPSAIDADLFCEANVGPTSGNNVLAGTLYFWTHNTNMVAANGIYSYNSGDYASYNGTGGTGTTESAPSSVDTGDYINTTIPSGKIAAGQGFFVKGISDDVDAEAIFNNSMRVAGENDEFFRPAPSTPVENWQTIGKHRVWLNLKGQVKGFSQALVGYIENATNNLDIRFDGESFGGNQVTLYSVLGNKKLVIQGRALPFDNQDEVPLGYKTTLTGTLNISIDHFDGLLQGQDIYLEDNLLNIVHDLKASAYSFTTVPGTFNERFVLRYLPAEELGNPDHEAIANGLIVYKNDKTLSITSQLETLQQVTIYDLLGRIIFDKTKIGQTTLDIQNVVMNEQPLIVKVQLANGQVVNKKIVY